MKKRLLNVIIILLFSFLFLILSLKIIDIINFKCIFKYFFNIYCAACGTTRMIKAILKLNFTKAFKYNPVMFILFIIVLIYIIYMIIVYIKKEEIKIPSLKIIILVIILLFIYMLIRNLPGFEYLRP